MLKVLIVHKDKFVEGHNASKWVTLPKDSDELLKDLIEVAGDTHSYVIAEVDTDMKLHVDEHENIQILNDSLQELALIDKVDRDKLLLINYELGHNAFNALQLWNNRAYFTIPANSPEALGKHLESKGLLSVELPEGAINWAEEGNKYLQGMDYIDLTKHGFYAILNS